MPLSIYSQPHFQATSNEPRAQPGQLRILNLNPRTTRYSCCLHQALNGWLHCLEPHITDTQL